MARKTRATCINRVGGQLVTTYLKSNFRVASDFLTGTPFNYTDWVCKAGRVDDVLFFLDQRPSVIVQAAVQECSIIFPLQTGDLVLFGMWLCVRRFHSLMTLL